MITRRETILGGALTLLWGKCACATPAPRPHGPGCLLPPEDAGAFFATATKEQLASTFSGKMIANSGNREFDYALALTLSRLSDMFGVLPGFCFYDDYEGMNAYATTATKLQRADGTVLFGKRYFAKSMAEAEHPDAAVLATCAHEFGHIVQYKHRLQGRLLAGQSTVKRAELNADFFAGYFAGARKLQKPDFPAAVFATNRHASGDYSFTDKSHHGTPDERAAAVVRGFETAYRERRSFSEAIGIGVRYAQTL